jgi:uncharacterized protein involved in exopolysaccharide biosynthesis
MNDRRRGAHAAFGGPGGDPGPRDQESPGKAPGGLTLDEITFHGLVTLVNRRRNLILATTAAATLVVLIVIFLILTPLYESTAVVLIKPGREFVSSASPDGGEAMPNRMDNIIMAELEILHSADLLKDTVIAIGPARLYPDLGDPGAPDPVYAASRRFRENFSATAVPGASVIRLSFRHPDPALAAESVNGLVARFKEHHLKAFSEPQSTTFLEGKVKEYREALEAAEQKVFQYQKTHPVVTVEDPAQELERQRVEIDTALGETRNNVEALNQRLAFLKKRASGLSRTSPLRRDLDLQIVSAEAELRSETARQQGLQKQRAEAQADTQSLPGYMRQYRDLLREREVAETRHRLYSERFEHASVSEEMDREKIANISVLQKGEIPPVPSYPRKMLILAVGSLFGLALGVGLALILEGVRAGQTEAS